MPPWRTWHRLCLQTPIFLGSSCSEAKRRLLQRAIRSSAKILATPSTQFFVCGCEARSSLSPSNLVVPRPPAQRPVPCRLGSLVCVSLFVPPCPLACLSGRLLGTQTQVSGWQGTRRSRGGGIWPVTPWSRRTGQSPGEMLAAQGAEKGYKEVCLSSSDTLGDRMSLKRTLLGQRCS